MFEFIFQTASKERAALYASEAKDVILGALEAGIIAEMGNALGYIEDGSCEPPARSYNDGSLDFTTSVSTEGIEVGFEIDWSRIDSMLGNRKIWEGAIEGIFFNVTISGNVWVTCCCTDKNNNTWNKFIRKVDIDKSQVEIFFDWRSSPLPDSIFASMVEQTGRVNGLDVSTNTGLTGESLYFQTPCN